MKAGSQKDVCTPVLTATLFTRAKERKLAKCPPMNEWISKMWYKQKMKYYSALTKKILTYAIIWMSLEGICYIEIIQP